MLSVVHWDFYFSKKRYALLFIILRLKIYSAGLFALPKAFSTRAVARRGNVPLFSLLCSLFFFFRRACAALARGCFGGAHGPQGMRNQAAARAGRGRAAPKLG